MVASFFKEQTDELQGSLDGYGVGAGMYGGASGTA
jgi:hypothetical protein